MAWWWDPTWAEGDSVWTVGSREINGCDLITSEQSGAETPMEKYERTRRCNEDCWSGVDGWLRSDQELSIGDRQLGIWRVACFETCDWRCLDFAIAVGSGGRSTVDGKLEGEWIGVVGTTGEKRWSSDFNRLRVGIVAEVHRTNPSHLNLSSTTKKRHSSKCSDCA